MPGNLPHKLPGNEGIFFLNGFRCEFLMLPSVYTMLLLQK